jgi:hypothetical protein
MTRTLAFYVYVALIKIKWRVPFHSKFNILFRDECLNNWLYKNQCTYYIYAIYRQSIQR